MKLLITSIALVVLFCPSPAVAQELKSFEVEMRFDSHFNETVEVQLVCNSGIPLVQSTSLSSNESIIFNVAEMMSDSACNISQAPIDGFTTSYSTNNGVISYESCFLGSLPDNYYECRIANTRTESPVKKWGEIIFGYEVIEQYGLIRADFEGEIVEARCGEGKMVLGGGWALLHGAPPQTTALGPSPDHGGFYLKADSESNESAEVVVTATCAHVSTKSG